VVRSLLAEATQDSTLAAIRMPVGPYRRVGAAIFVAAANQGTPLAQPADVQSFLNIAAMLATISGALGLDLVIALARLVLNQGCSAPALRRWPASPHYRPSLPPAAACWPQRASKPRALILPTVAQRWNKRAR
jgi:hypothetical protein